MFSPEMKTCSKCKEQKYLVNFKPRKERPGKYNSRCNNCLSPNILPVNILPNEIWKDIPDYEGYYQISNFGRIKSMSRTLYNGSVHFQSTEKLLRTNTQKKNYITISLTKYKVRKTHLVHVLVAVTFLDYKHNPEDNFVVDHIDNNPRNPSLSNLQVITSRENITKDKRNKTSTHPGVYWCATHQKWRTQIAINHHKIFIGRYSVESDAADAYKLCVENLNMFNGDSNIFRQFIKQKICIA